MEIILKTFTHLDNLGQHKVYAVLSLLYNLLLQENIYVDEYEYLQIQRYYKMLNRNSTLPMLKIEGHLRNEFDKEMQKDMYIYTHTYKHVYTHVYTNTCTQSYKLAHHTTPHHTTPHHTTHWSKQCFMIWDKWFLSIRKRLQKSPKYGEKTTFPMKKNTYGPSNREKKTFPMKKNTYGPSDKKNYISNEEKHLWPLK